jgi:hypothetical protein
MPKEHTQRLDVSNILMLQPGLAVSFYEPLLLPAKRKTTRRYSQQG